MCEFLSGGALRAAVERVLAGTDVRCAVAFWGDGAAEFLARMKPEDPRIVCDIDMGATSPRTLRALGAPENDRVRECDRLHAKVYLSDVGAVVGSANMSANGLGFGSKAGLRETAVFLAPDGDAFRSAARWFEIVYSGSRQVDGKALKRAEKAHRPSVGMIGSTLAKTGSLLDLVVNHPNSFGDVGFVFCSKISTKKDQLRSKKDMIKLHPFKADQINDWDESRTFLGWGRRVVRRWPKNCVEFFRPTTELGVFFHKLSIVNEARADVFTADGRTAIQAEVSIKLPTAKQIAKADDALVERLLSEKDARVFRSAHALREAILNLDA